MRKLKKWAHALYYRSQTLRFSIEVADQMSFIILLTVASILIFALLVITVFM